MKKITSLLLLIMMLLSYGCQMDDYGIGGNKSSQNGFTLNYYVSGAVASETKSTVPSAQGEEDIQSFYLLIFENSANGSGQFLHAVDLSDQVQSMGTAGTINLEFDAQSGISTSEDYVLLFLANVEHYFDQSIGDFLQSIEGSTEEMVIQEYSYLVESGIGGDANPGEDEDYDTHIVDIEAIPMSARHVKLRSEQTVSVELIRNVSRFDVRNQASGYTLVSASIWNAYPEISIWDRSFFTYEENRIKRFYGIETNNNVIHGGLYAFENYVVAPQQDDKETTCLIVGLVAEGETDVYYYRINVNSSYLGQQLKKNNVYTTTITTVYSRGATCEKDAWEESEFLLEVDINGWDVDDNGSIQYDGENILAVPVNKLNFTYQADVRELSIFTLGTGTLEISKESLFPGLSVVLEGSTLTVSVENAITDQTGYVEVKFGNLRSTITITQTAAKTEWIELSHSSVPIFSSKSSEADQSATEVTVTSSGKWIATIYNHDNAFTFGTSSLQDKDGPKENGQSFKATVLNDNTDVEPRYAFVLVSLEDNPEVSRVLVLMQRGIGGVELTHPATMTFSPQGEPEGYPNTYVHEYYEINVKASNGSDDGLQLQWTLSEISVPDNFSYQIVGNNIIRIYADVNTGTTPLSARYRVTIPETGAIKEFVVNQQAHSVSVSSSSYENVGKEGGSTAPFFVTSTGAWTATLEASGNTAYFNATENLTTFSGMNGGSFTVTFPPVTSAVVSPEATVTVTIDGTDVKHVFTVKQDALIANLVTWVTYSNTTGSVANSNTYIIKMRNFMDDKNSFGRNGTVYMPQDGYQYAVNNYVERVNTTLFQIPNVNVAAGRRNELISWWAQAGNVLVYTPIASQSRSEAVLSSKSSSFSYSNIAAATGAGLIRQFTDKTNAITEYMLNGPFTREGVTLTYADISLISSGQASRTLTNYPSTFVPLLFHPNGDCVVGVDPVLRLIYIGNPSLFSNYGNATNNWGSNREANEIFLKNFIAWITNAAMYGDDFLDQFK